MLYLEKTGDNVKKKNTPGQETSHVVNKSGRYVNNGLSKVHQDAMKKNADMCKYFQISTQNGSGKSCLYCTHLDAQVYSCGKLSKPVIPYEWV